jgi:hypothetical protein
MKLLDELEARSKLKKQLDYTTKFFEVRTKIMVYY